MHTTHTHTHTHTHTNANKHTVYDNKVNYNSLATITYTCTNTCMNILYQKDIIHVCVTCSYLDDSTEDNLCATWVTEALYLFPLFQ